MDRAEVNRMIRGLKVQEKAPSGITSAAKKPAISMKVPVSYVNDKPSGLPKASVPSIVEMYKASVRRHI